jgi:hypothetical protein
MSYKSTSLSSPTRQIKLPGPNRKRHPRTYAYRLRLSNPQMRGPGCVMMWEVAGGRAVYQIVLERQETGTLRWHCSCADAVYRGENGPHVCKHVRGLLEMGAREDLAA